ncbi:hypothetical protein METBIDRAFT_31049 [Metschnikowia bicuspidata var. bicuspidata NRRL YB-4993]|uniref:Uncharacterized protein n=1 Tax=Metschnikowia bicuspidata var. bicuspidata NRRL YB-4993 TaxID=869754 RepID=A0A1A0HDW7_9ASCO|nr:hypothetical protein METBIDRAFT_31049 [Metschnikowia bicuspidata var. bicuspidata NRRL YB-4993]OBA22092.1 hypothetical protein METBIDRAFT_31049 [Metschnikowia bicuspidata var. bicuspidata NRRL YB-4993]
MQLISKISFLSAVSVTLAFPQMSRFIECLGEDSNRYIVDNPCDSVVAIYSKEFRDFDTKGPDKQLDKCLNYVALIDSETSYMIAFPEADAFSGYVLDSPIGFDHFQTHPEFSGAFCSEKSTNKADQFKSTFTQKSEEAKMLDEL